MWGCVSWEAVYVGGVSWEAVYVGVCEFGSCVCRGM